MDPVVENDIKRKNTKINIMTKIIFINLIYKNDLLF